MGIEHGVEKIWNVIKLKMWELRTQKVIYLTHFNYKNKTFFFFT